MMFVYAKRGAMLESERERIRISHGEKLLMALLNSPSPIAAQQRTVTMDRVTFRLVIEWAGRGFRSQHLDIKYSSNVNSERMRAAAGSEPRIPRLCERNFSSRRSIFRCTRSHLEINLIGRPECIVGAVKCNVQMGQRVQYLRQKRDLVLVLEKIVVAHCH